MSGPATIEIGLNAAIVAVSAMEPQILVVVGPPGEGDGLPFGPFEPLQHRTLEIGLRRWVEAQTGLVLGYVEQLYTFGDRGRHARLGDHGPHVLSIGYLALTKAGESRDLPAVRPRAPEPADPAMASSWPIGAAWRPWYTFFPWEDWRGGRPAILDTTIMPLMTAWAAEAPPRDEPPRPLGRAERLGFFFGEGAAPWDDEKALERYELLYEAGLVAEAERDGRPAALARGTLPPIGQPMRFDHRRILATAISRLRAKLKYRPIVFELMPETFTLTELQRTVEAISGRHVHKQNFRRLVESGALVEATGRTRATTGGRPAQIFRFRRDVLRERPAPGLRLGRP